MFGLHARRHDAGTPPYLLSGHGTMRSPRRLCSMRTVDGNTMSSASLGQTATSTTPRARQITAVQDVMRGLRQPSYVLEQELQRDAMEHRCNGSPVALLPHATPPAPPVTRGGRIALGRACSRAR